MSDAERTAGDVPLPGGDFRLFLTRMAYQGMMAAGLIENPVTGNKAAHPSNARMIVDDLGMLIEKTQGNLTLDEKEHLDKVYSDLSQVVAKLPE